MHSTPAAGFSAVGEGFDVPVWNCQPDVSGKPRSSRSGRGIRAAFDMAPPWTVLLGESARPGLSLGAPQPDLTASRHFPAQA